MTCVSKNHIRSRVYKSDISQFAVALTTHGGSLETLNKVLCPFQGHKYRMLKNEFKRVTSRPPAQLSVSDCGARDPGFESNVCFFVLLLLCFTF